jgi:quercetin dioxygenase-like cupin family protein
MKTFFLTLAFFLGLSGLCFAAGDDVHVEELLKTTESWEGTVLPAYSQGQPEVTILKIEIPPGAQLPMHLHPVINAAVLTKGKLTVETIDGKVLHMESGDAMAEVVNKGHLGRNEGSETAEIIVFYAGIKDQPITQTL